MSSDSNKRLSTPAVKAVWLPPPWQAIAIRGRRPLRVTGPPPEGAGPVEKALELIGTGDSVQDAVTEALDRARMTLEGITGFEVTRISGVVDGATTEYRVELRVWFVLRERMHG